MSQRGKILKVCPSLRAPHEISWNRPILPLGPASLACSQMFVRALLNKLPVCKRVFPRELGWNNSHIFLSLPKYLHLGFYEPINSTESIYAWVCVRVCTCVYTMGIVLHIEKSFISHHPKDVVTTGYFRVIHILTLNVLTSIKVCKKNFQNTLNAIHLHDYSQLISIWSNETFFPLVKSINLLAMPITDALINIIGGWKCEVEWKQHSSRWILNKAVLNLIETLWLFK